MNITWTLLYRPINLLLKNLNPNSTERRTSLEVHSQDTIDWSSFYRYETVTDLENDSVCKLICSWSLERLELFERRFKAKSDILPKKMLQEFSSI